MLAISGVEILFENQFQVWIHFFVMFWVLFVGLFFKISFLEWILILFAISLVIICEIFDALIEYIASLYVLDTMKLSRKLKI